MPRTKNVSAPGGGDDEDPRCPFRQVKSKTIYLEQQEGRKKRRTDRIASAAPPAIDPALASILQSLTQQQAHLAAEQTRLSETMLSMFQTI
jgi:hypothetical protein